MREILISCGGCHAKGKPRVPARIHDIAVRSYVQDSPSAPVALTGTLELCDDCAAPLLAVPGLIADHGEPLSDEARKLLTERPVVVKKGDRSAFVWCWTCSEPKQLRPGSVDNHARQIHRMVKTSLDVRGEGKH